MSQTFERPERKHDDAVNLHIQKSSRKPGPLLLTMFMQRRHHAAHVRSPLYCGWQALAPPAAVL